MDVLNPPEMALADDTGIERRDTARHRCDLPAFVEPLGINHAGQWPARTYDLAPTGLGLVLSRRFEPGTCLLVRLRGDQSVPSVTLAARVVRVVLVSSGWLMGCCFPRVMHPDEFQAMLQQATQVTAPGVRETKTLSTTRRLDLRLVREKLRSLCSPPLIQDSAGSFPAADPGLGR